MTSLHFNSFLYRAGIRICAMLFIVCSLVWLGACATQSTLPTATLDIQRTLAPNGELRVGVYPGSPTSLMLSKEGRRSGISLELGERVAKQLGVPVRVVEFARIAQIVEAMKRGEIDLTFTNASPARAQDLDFTTALLKQDLGLLVAPRRSLAHVDAMDRVGTRIGVSEGSSSFNALKAQLKSSVLITAASLPQAAQLLREGKMDAFATNKGILLELQEQVPGSALAQGRWGEERFGVAVPKGRAAGQEWLNAAMREAAVSGALAKIVERSGLRGAEALQVQPQAK